MTLSAEQLYEISAILMSGGVIAFFVAIVTIIYHRKTVGRINSLTELFGFCLILIVGWVLGVFTMFCLLFWNMQ